MKFHYIFAILINKSTPHEKLVSPVTMFLFGIIAFAAIMIITHKMDLDFKEEPRFWLYRFLTACCCFNKYIIADTPKDINNPNENEYYIEKGVNKLINLENISTLISVHTSGSTSLKSPECQWIPKPKEKSKPHLY